MGKLNVYGRKTSSNVQPVMWLIAELGLEHAQFDYGGKYASTASPEFRAMSPHGVVPVIRDGDDPAIFESQAILRYIAGRYGNETIWPADPARRAQIDMWMEWGKTTVYANFGARIFWPRVRTAAKDRDEAVLTASIEAFGRVLDKLEDQLECRAHVCGDALTLADFTIGTHLFRYFDIDIPRPRHDRVAAYYERLTKRPHYAAHVMVDYSELKAEGA